MSIAKLTRSAAFASSFYPIHFKCFTRITSVLFSHNIPLVIWLLFKPEAQSGKNITHTHLNINKAYLG
jgi:hypothetical protein